ncbi:mavicyanin-like [Coffea eugenioides]|uniref:mavicyanin-like n=1 Tax=Coffea eugenioides TaxID=49369 RepID=UPI000F5C4928|nr:mavicyanin-like isoform X1 [Coffea arabica]XP_027185857.1 mavicyanin-like [Coffea eugenioides]
MKKEIKLRYGISFSCFLHASLVCVLLLCGARCETYTVGDEDNWSIGVNYLAWSTKYNFTVDDILVFKYTKGEHNVYEVSEATFRSCDASSGVVAKYTSGSDQIELKEAKKYWFICDISGHCLDGMRFGVDVSQAGAASNTTASGTSASAPLPSTNPNPNNASERGTSVIYLLLVLDLLLKFS